MRRAIVGTLLAGFLSMLYAAPAGAEFGFKEVDVRIVDENGAPALQAGSHPFAMEAELAVNSVLFEGGPEEVPDGAVEDLSVGLPVGLAGDPKALPRCSAADFINISNGRNSCPDATALGIAALLVSDEPFPPEATAFIHVPTYNLAPPPGMAARLGFNVLGVPVTIDVGVNPNPPYNVEAHPTNIAQAVLFYSSVLTTWGDPASPVHDPFRGNCLEVLSPGPVDELISLGECSAGPGERKPFLTLPRSCEGPLETTFHALAWNTGETASTTAFTPPGMIGCPELGFGPTISSQPTSDNASSPSGLDFAINIDNEGLVNPTGLADSDIKQIEVTLPEGVTINPSQAEGLAVCSEEKLAKETVNSPFGKGCPPASKIGSIEVETPLLEGEILKGSLFVAEPFANLAGDSLIAFYLVIKHPELGIIVKQAARVEPDPKTGQLVTTTEDMPQLPFSDFRLHFREGGRSPLITPPRCGTYETEAFFTPWANPSNPLPTTSSFQITEGVGGGSCPSAGPPPFVPGFSGGALGNSAGAFSPFHIRLTRRDGDQDLTRFDATLPLGSTAKLAGVSQCPQSAVEAAKSRSGKAELAAPSCPANSKIGTVQGGAGVGSQLTYVPGSIYLAGPIGGAPLSVVGIVPAVAGPFDVGTVVTQQALQVDPRTAEVRVDGAASDPIPHILAGIPLAVRDIQVDVDRSNFTLNPTSCEPMALKADIWGGGSNLFSAADDSPVPRQTRFQAADCAALGFKPRLSLRLKGGTRRGAHPALRTVFRPRPGDANTSRLSVRFPRSAFVEQAHIRTVCTRVQFAADACPKGAIYGQVTAFTPLLSEPLTGPIYLRSSDNLLPDLVFDLHGLVDFEAVARIDSVRGALRAIVTGIPDAPIEKVVVQMQGGDKSLIVNSRNLCRGKNRAKLRLDAHNNRRRNLRAAVKASCKKGRKANRAKRGR